MIYIVASTLPRHRRDPEPAFILDYAVQCAKIDKVTIYSPNHPKVVDDIYLTDVSLKKFRYLPLRRCETLCGDGGIPSKIHTWRGKLSLLCLLASEFVLFLKLHCRLKEQDSLHVHWLFPQGLAYAVASIFTRKPKVRTVLVLHSGRASRQSWLYLRLERFIFSKFDVVTCNNQRTRTELKNIYRRPIYYLPMGLPTDVQAQTPKLNRQPNLKMVSVGRWVPVKGYIELCHAWLANDMQNTDWELTLLGHGSLAAALRKLLAQNMIENIKLVERPTRDQIFKYLGEATYYLQPSIVLPNGQTEGFGLAVLEALWFGCTPLVTLNGGLPEVIGDTGYAAVDSDALLKGLLAGKFPPIELNKCYTRASNFLWSPEKMMQVMGFDPKAKRQAINNI